METRLHQAFDYLSRNGMQPTWLGNKIIANVPGITLGTNGKPNIAHTTPQVVRTYRQAVRLVMDCN